MQIDFARPWALLLLPVLVGIIIWSARGLHRKSRTGKFGEIGLRLLVMFLVVLALSGISIQKKSDMTTTIFLVDLSDSVQQVQQEEADFIQSAIAGMPEKNQAGIVVFGSDSRIEQFVSEKKIFTDFQSQVTATATNLEQAVQTALALFPDGSACRLVLLTDGAENAGAVEELTEVFKASSTELKVVRYDVQVDEEVYVSDVSVPETIHQGEQFQVQVEIYATEAMEANVSLYSGRTLKGQKTVRLQKGTNQLVFADQGAEGGLKPYRVTVEAEKDTVSINNAYSAFTTVEAKSRLLVVEGGKNESTAFIPVLEACNYEYEVVTPAGVPVQLSDFTEYQSIILLDVYADDLREGFLENLELYVKDYAGGLIVAGGENSFALGNYRNTALEDILPVNMDLEGEKQIPKISMTMVIDHSSSMMTSSTGQEGGISCLSIAKQAAINALDSMRTIDEVGVLAFDDKFQWTVKPQSVTDIDALTSMIAGISSGGGTSIYPAVAEAVEQMKKSDASLKHIILLTDGQDGYNQYESLLKDMNEQGITLSTVAIGTGADSATLSALAEKGGGRYYYSDAGTTLPRIFLQEVYLSAKRYLINEEFTPVIVNSHEILEGVFSEGSPSLLGYIAASPKSTSTVVLQSHREDPILTVWQYGLGRSVAWNSDVTGQWTQNFAGWDNYAKLWNHIIDWSISDTDLGEDTLQLQQTASSAVITYETKDYDKDTKISAVLTDEDGNQQDVTLKAVSPGIYEAELSLDQVGVYSVSVRNEKGKETVKHVNTAVAMQYSPEYRYESYSGGLERFVEQVSGRYITTTDEVFDTQPQGTVTKTEITDWLLYLAAILFVLDVLVRRMHLNWLNGMAGAVKNAAGRVGQRNGSARTGKGRKTAEISKNAEGKKIQAGAGTGSKVNAEEGKAGTEANRVELKADKNETVKASHEKSDTITGEKQTGKAPEKQHQKPEVDKKQVPLSGRKKKPAAGQGDVLDTAALLKKKKERDL